MYIVLLLIILFLISIFIFQSIKPNSYKVERSIIINTPVDKIWEQVVYFKNWRNWSPWLEKDSSLTNSYEGVDGSVGAVSSYSSIKSGAGKMKNISVKENEEILYCMHFLKPWESKSEGYLRLENVKDGVKVTWGFEGKHNFVSKFLNMDKMIGPDFKRGLELLDEVVRN